MLDGIFKGTSCRCGVTVGKTYTLVLISKFKDSGLVL